MRYIEHYSIYFILFSMRLNLLSILFVLTSFQIKTTVPKITIGDYIQVSLLITEGNKERVQITEGIVIAKKHTGINTSITVRRTLQGIGVERIFLIHSPKVAKLKIIRHSKIRKAKLYFLRNRIGKSTRLKRKL